MSNNIKLMQLISGAYTYSMFKTNFKSEDYGEIPVYGIEICNDTECSSIEDISDSAQEVTELFKLIYELELFPEHLADVVEDFLADRNLITDSSMS